MIGCEGHFDGIGLIPRQHSDPPERALEFGLIQSELFGRLLGDDLLIVGIIAFHEPGGEQSRSCGKS